MPRRPILPGIDTGGTPSGVGSELRAALARWATGVAVLAVRHDGAIQAMTITAFLPVSFDPPRIAVAVGQHAPLSTLLPPGTSFGISILGEDQRRWANVFADAFAADRSGFPPAGDPVLAGCIAALSCTVVSAEPVGDHVLVLASVLDVHSGEDDAPLLYFERAYRRLSD
jgi:flavin reductase (DIM6/NTAB) family NADH-FMN oxidoreductase RutF